MVQSSQLVARSGTLYPQVVLLSFLPDWAMLSTAVDFSRSLCRIADVEPDLIKATIATARIAPY